MFLGRSLTTRGQLPVETTSFVGREAELARLCTLPARARLVTVTGPGGAGKTRLAPGGQRCALRVKQETCDVAGLAGDPDDEDDDEDDGNAAAEYG